MRALWRVYLGALLVIAGIAALIEAHANRPMAATSATEGFAVNLSPHGASGLSPTAYDLLRIAGWALLILGVVTLTLGFMQYRAQVKP